MSTNMRNIHSKNSRNSIVTVINANQRRNPTRADDEKKPSTTPETITTNTERSLSTVILNEKKSSRTTGPFAGGSIPTMVRLEEKPSSKTLATNSSEAIRTRYPVISDDENQVTPSGSFEQWDTVENRTETPRETLTLADESSGTTSSALPNSVSATRLSPPPSLYTSLMAEDDFNKWPNAEERTNVVSEESESSLESGIDTRNLYGDRENVENWVMSTMEYRSPVEDDFEIGSIGDSDQHDIGDFERMDQNREAVSRYLRSAFDGAGAADGSSAVQERPSVTSVDDSAGAEDRSSSVAILSAVDSYCGGEAGPPGQQRSAVAGNAASVKPKCQREHGADNRSGNGKCRKPEKPAWRGPLDWCPSEDRSDGVPFPRRDAPRRRPAAEQSKRNPDRIGEVYRNAWPRDQVVDEKPTVKPCGGVLKASASINRMAKRREEARVNDILAKKLSAVRPVVNTSWKK